MQHFSSIYEKLIDMGFTNDAIDAAIKKGHYTFDMIFNDLVETDPDLKAYSDSNNYNKCGNISQPVLKLRANPNLSMFDGSIEDKLLDMTFNDVPDLNEPAVLKYDRKLLMSPQLYMDDNQKDGDWMAINSILQCDSSGGHNTHSVSNHEAAINGPIITEAISSSISSSLIFTNKVVKISSNEMTKIQIMDLLDPTFEPLTFSHPFLSSICTIRDLICWFHQCRYSINPTNNFNLESQNNRLAISFDTSLNNLIEQFQELKWHFVMPSGAQSIRIFGEEYLNRSIESLGLSPSAHLLAIVSCPSQLQKQTSKKSSLSSSLSITNGNHWNMNKCCSIQINLMDTLMNSVDYQLNCDPEKTTLQRIALDFAHISNIDIGSFALVRHQPQQKFSYPGDYMRTLSDLGISADNTILYCYLLDQNSSNHTNNSSDESLINVTSDLMMSVPSSESSTSVPSVAACVSPNLPFLSVSNSVDQTLPINSFASTSSSLDPLSRIRPTQNRTTELQPFSGVGIPLSGYRSDKTVAELWANRSFKIATLDLPKPFRPDRKPQTLLQLCYKEIYRFIKVHNNVISKSMRKLPNNIQQIFIKLLLEDKLLTTSLLAYFCAAGSNLTYLDLSHTLLATNEVLKCVSKCSSLEELILDNEEHTFSNEGLWHLKYLKHLKRLSLNYCSKINDWGIQIVGVLPALSAVSIKYTAVTNVGFKHIYLHLTSQNEPVSIPPIRSIDLSGLTISDECMLSISIFDKLELLNLSSTHITDPLSFPRLPELRHLDISHCHKLLWQAQLHIKSLSESFPKLSSINVRGVSTSNLVHITMAISHCKYIRQLDGIFCHPQMTASLAASLSHLPLETIVLMNCRHVTDLWLPVIARFSATLTHFVLSSCSGITGSNNSILNNLSRLRNLIWLDLTHLDNVDASQIWELLEGNCFPKLQVVWISLNDQREHEFRNRCQHLNFTVNVTKSLINPFNVGSC